MGKKKPPAACPVPCSPDPPFAARPPLSFVEAVKAMALFKMLASDTRVRLLHHLLRAGEATVTDLGKAVGMKPQAVSNQLVRLTDTGLLASRRDGNNVYHRVVNRCVAPLLELVLCLMADNPDGCRSGGPQ